MLFKKKKYIASDSLSGQAWKRFRKNKLAMFFAYLILAFVLIAIIGYQIIPDDTPMSNTQFLELKAQKPGFSVKMLKIRKNDKKDKTTFFRKMFFGAKSDYKLIPIYSFSLKNNLLEYEEYTGFTPNEGETKSIPLINMAFSIPEGEVIKKTDNLHDTLFEFADIDGKKVKITQAELVKKVESQIIKKRFLLGSDQYGRDMFSRLVIGTRISLAVGFISVLISLVVGIFIGAIGGYFRGWIDDIIVWFINVVWSIPTLLLVIAITFALGKGFWQVFIAVGLTMWVEVARVVRGQILSIREKEFVEAAKALGYRNFRIIFRHILPNVMGPVIVIAAANFASAILIEAGLSFLGIGVQPPMPSWGEMIKSHYFYITLDSAFLAILPGLAIMIMVLAFMIVGNGLRDALDVRTE